MADQGPVHAPQAATTTVAPATTSHGVGPSGAALTEQGNLQIAKIAAAGTPGGSATPPDTKESVTALAMGLYSALGSNNNAALSAFYDPNVTFHDPLFGDIQGATKVIQMWALCGNGSTNVNITPHIVSATPMPAGGWQVQVHWDAHYEFGPLHHPVINHSDTTLHIVHGKVVSQVDSWDLTAWTKQAMPEIGGAGNFVATRAMPLALDAVHGATEAAHGAHTAVDWLKSKL